MSDAGAASVPSKARDRFSGTDTYTGRDQICNGVIGRITFTETFRGHLVAFADGRFIFSGHVPASVVKAPRRVQRVRGHGHMTIVAGVVKAEFDDFAVTCG